MKGFCWLVPAPIRLSLWKLFKICTEAFCFLRCMQSKELFYFSIYLEKKMACLTLMEMLQCLTIDKKTTVGTLPVCYVDRIKTRFYILRVVICARWIPQIEAILHKTNNPAVLVVQSIYKLLFVGKLWLFRCINYYQYNNELLPVLWDSYSLQHFPGNRTYVWIHIWEMIFQGLKGHWLLILLCFWRCGCSSAARALWPNLWPFSADWHSIRPTWHHPIKDGSHPHSEGSYPGASARCYPCHLRPHQPVPGPQLVNSSHQQRFSFLSSLEEKESAAWCAVHTGENSAACWTEEPGKIWLWCPRRAVAQSGLGYPRAPGVLVHFLWKEQCTRWLAC